MARGGDAIASGSVVLTTNADGLKAGLSKASADVNSWGANLSKSGGMGGGASGGGGMFGGLLSGAGGIVSKLGPAGMAIGAVGAAAGAAAVGLKLASDTLDDISKQGAMASALGLTAEQFTGIAGVAKSAGEDTKEFIESLVTMGKLGENAAAGTEEAAKAFRGLGLNANEFIKLRPDEQFFEIMDALDKMGASSERTRLMMAAFGDDGGKLLLPLLGKSKQELQGMAKGFEVSGESMKKAMAASAATKGMEAKLGKLWQALAIMAAPFIEKIATVGTKIIDGLKPGMDWLQRAADAYFPILFAYWDELGSAAASVADWFREVGEELFGPLEQLPTVEQAMIGYFRAVGHAGSYMWDTLKAGAGFFSIGIGVIVKGVGVLIDKFKGAFRSIADMGADAADALGLTETAGQFRQIGAAADRIAVSIWDAGDDMMKWGKGAVDGFGNSAKQFDKWLDHAAAKGKETAAQIGQDVELKVGDAVKSLASAPIELSGAVNKGSKEAYSMTIKNQLRGLNGATDPAKQMVGEQKKANRINAKAERGIDAMRQRLDRLEAV